MEGHSPLHPGRDAPAALLCSLQFYSFLYDKIVYLKVRIFSFDVQENVHLFSRKSLTITFSSILKAVRNIFRLSKNYRYSNDKYFKGHLLDKTSSYKITSTIIENEFDILFDHVRGAQNTTLKWLIRHL